ncbi:MAG: hypothetical protein AB7P03_11970 [Kofleriaceae bacterium]
MVLRRAELDDVSRSSRRSGPTRRIGAWLIAVTIGLTAQGHWQLAFAQDDDEADDGGDDEDGADAGDGVDPESDDESEDDEDEADDQPAVTAGGLYTLRSYPVRELFRPLTMTERIVQLRLGLGTDVSAKGAFESVGVSLEAIYGARDNVSVIGGFTSAYNFKAFGLYAGVEAALAYDLVDFRTAVRLNRSAVQATDMMGLPVPGEYEAGDVSAAIDLGFPFRYVARPEIAIVALNTLMSINFDRKPDLNPSLGIATNPIAPLSVVVFAQLQIPEFDTDVDKFKVPATARIQFSPNQKLDIGGEFTFLDLKPAEGNFYDNRFLTLYMQSRFGR